MVNHLRQELMIHKPMFLPCLINQRLTLYISIFVCLGIQSKRLYSRFKFLEQEGIHE
jgi:hypothetical protein